MTKEVHIVITNNGDGSNGLKWFRRTSYEQLLDLDEVTGDYEMWGSGDGVQIKSLSFPDDFNLDSLGISRWEWADDEVAEIRRELGNLKEE
jgi:saccharopine dehydrogenase-like NADP-dependent oxidoreductase